MTPTRVAELLAVATSDERLVECLDAIVAQDERITELEEALRGLLAAVYAAGDWRDVDPARRAEAERVLGGGK